MASSPVVAPPHPCASCPFRRKSAHYLRPSALAVVAGNLRDRLLHNCHGNHRLYCMGGLAYLHRRGELEQFQMWRILTRLGALSEEVIDATTDVFASWAEAKREHRRREQEGV